MYSLSLILGAMIFVVLNKESVYFFLLTLYVKFVRKKLFGMLKKERMTWQKEKIEYNLIWSCCIPNNSILPNFVEKVEEFILSKITNYGAVYKLRQHFREGEGVPKCWWLLMQGGGGIWNVDISKFWAKTDWKLQV